MLPFNIIFLFPSGITNLLCYIWCLTRPKKSSWATNYILTCWRFNENTFSFTCYTILLSDNKISFLSFLVGAMFCRLGLDKLVLRCYDLASRARTSWADERLREPEWAEESQSESELEWARVTVTEWAKDNARVGLKEQGWARVSQSEPEWARESLAHLYLTAHHVRQWEVDWLTKCNVKIRYCLVLNSTLVSFLCKDNDGDVVCQCKHSRGELFVCKRPLWPPSLCASWSSKTVLFMQKISK